MIRFKTFRYSLGILIIIAALCGFWQIANAQVVEIPDPNLERAIREKLELSSEVPITQQQMLELTGFAAEAAQVENITGLEYATNLKNLYLRNNPIKDLTPIANLTQLELLHLPGAPIKDLTPIQNLTKLKSLTLSHCELTDITPIQNLTALVFANLSVNRISDITPLANLTALETLWIDVNQIVDISPLANLTRLKELDLHSNRIVDISPLANLTRLKELDLYTNRIVDISPLANLRQLQKLDLTYNHIVDVSPLANLTALEILWMPVNRVLDFSPLQGLSLTDFRYDEVCVLPHPPIRDRIANRNLPSIIQAWDDGIQNRPELSYYDRIAHHDLFWHHLPFGLRFQQTPPWHHLAGDLEVASVERDKLVSKNPNMLFLVSIRFVTAALNRHYPEDWPYWLRDEDGNLVSGSRSLDTSYLIDFRLPEVQNIVVQQAIAVARCGVYDGIHFDRWLEDVVLLTTIHGDQYLQYEGTPEYHKALEEERQARVSILKQIREAVPDDFLIICNNNWNRSHLAAPYINGGMMETFRDHNGDYTNSHIAYIEDALLWYEENVREPKINVLRGEGLWTEPPDSPDNRRWMRLFTTMSLTCSDGYALYTIGGFTAEGHKQYQNHIWYDFWDANLGQPISPTAQPYQGIPSLYIREFTNGWAVYNRSGQAQTITLPSSATPVSDRGNNAASTTHLLPNLDGEIYLTSKSIADVNHDGVVNILDLVHVANNFGKAAPDPNGDGVVNILDLTLVAKHLSQNAAAPSQLALIESIPSTAKEVIAVQRALNELEAIPNKSHGVQIAIELLRHYLSIADPNVQETKLLSNYPNPFNPDTWIPYQLSEGSTVTVKIYDVTGSLVRTIQVGHKPAGYYHTRERAIYWDGRNQNREPVSSGVYFYTLNTDTYTQTRRMVIAK